MRKLLLVVGLSALLPSIALAAPTSGRYGALTLAVVGNEVSGTFSDGRLGNGNAEAPQFSCMFMFHGTLEGKQAKLRTWSPDDRPEDRIAGVLRQTEDGVSIQLDENHAGCMMASGDMVDSPYENDLISKASDWIGTAMITVDRARLYPAPQESQGRTPYLVEFDVVAVLERRSDWVRVRYLDGKRPVEGWLRTADANVDIAQASAPAKPR